MNQRADIIGARIQPPGVPNYGAHEGYPVRFTDDEAWMCVDGKWLPTNPGEILFTAHWLFHEEFGELPPLPDAAFVRN